MRYIYLFSFVEEVIKVDRILYCFKLICRLGSLSL